MATIRAGQPGGSLPWRTPGASARAEKPPNRLARGLPWILGLTGSGCRIMFVAWGRATLVLLVYGLLARIQVVLITWFAMGKDWNTHYTTIPPFFTGIAAARRP